MIMLTGVRRHSSGNDSVHTHRQGKTLSNTFNTYNTFKAPRWTNRTGNGPTLIFSRTRKVLVYSTPSVAIISVWTQILEKSHSSRYVLAFCPYIAKKNSQIHNSQRLTNVKLHLNHHHNIHNIHDIHNIQSIHLCISRRLIERHKTEESENDFTPCGTLPPCYFQATLWLTRRHVCGYQVATFDKEVAACRQDGRHLWQGGRRL